MSLTPVKIYYTFSKSTYAYNMEKYMKYLK